jgi:hypothetical protein
MRNVCGSILMLFIVSFSMQAAENGKLQKYFHETSTKVKAAQSADEKRSILNGSFQSMNRALEMVQQMQSLSKNDRNAIERMTSGIREKQQELAGTDGFTRVQDSQLDSFSEYAAQDMEQADLVISVSLVTLLLILIVILLVVK